MPAPIASNASDVLGYRNFICPKCYQPEIVPCYASADPKKRGGLGDIDGWSCVSCDSFYNRKEIKKAILIP